ncbi:glycosyltransferase [Oryzobacter sp. R7]|uniref:glycosyltransferase n=1 Tax=Oryzobacter faecalis TaxID=3388656 RepID=UPI00398C9869
MAEVVFTTWDGGGNVPPAFAIGRELLARGHAVRFLGHRSQAPAIEDAGFEVVAAPRSRELSPATAPSTVEMLATFADRGAALDLLAELDHRPADVVVVDALTLGALDAARRSGVPYCVLEHFHDTYYRGALRGPLGLLLRATGLRPVRALDAAAARIVTSLPALDPVEPSPNLHQVGPVVTWRPRAEGAAPSVLVALSTFGFARMTGVLQRVLDATDGLGVQVVVTTGPHIDPTDLRVPPGTVVHRWADHADLMARATVLVGHGGHGTTLQALAHDLPVLVLPMDAKTDQPLVGHALEDAGAGRVLPRSAPPARIREAVAALLADGPHRGAAARLGAQVRATRAAADAADVIEQVAAPAPVESSRDQDSM